MPIRLGKEEVVTIRVLAEKGQKDVQIARTVGVSEGTVRHHLWRPGESAEDSRRGKPERAATLSEVSATWHAESRDATRSVYVMELWEHLVAKYGYSGSYQSVRRFVERLFSELKCGPTDGWRRCWERRARRTGPSTRGGRSESVRSH